MPDQAKYINKLKGVRVLIIGGTSGIGFGVAEAAIEHGAGKVIVSSSREARVKDAVARLKASYPSSTASVEGYVCDVGDLATMEENITDLFNKVGTLDHIVYSAGDSPPLRPFASVDFAFIQRSGYIRFYGPLLVALHGHKNLVQGPQSSIIITTGATSEKPWAGSAVVGSWLSGLQGMTRGLALELKPLRVNLISPGGIDTALWDYRGPDERKAVIDELTRDTTVGVIGTVEDVAEAYIYCMKDHFVTGTMISSNGGRFLV
ncbi:uncharacterized protein Z520_00185 [Fonsecaea multimorphosa CBS 102226]|uniref:Uncharacterized protein n=1 Tax=Fonsecaea multimorphosa CBS 102226 TaxID=1442371 RepID=A0A0D2L366_9EURO|nr:uncharacterized protein Z520_00185 [Fonsecaea multimorphosa CBS 102226]KIY03494.1 hypothetical protein Z520_00185 [Fonsecaea multimorphosa CBS 102226]OAL32751.1 hypothetical protein AYO22_00225 [Fonsecaea multimorphosa]